MAFSPYIAAVFVSIYCAAAAEPGDVYWWRYPSSDCGYDDVATNCTGASLEDCKVGFARQPKDCLVYTSPKLKLVRSTPNPETAYY